MIGLLEQEWLLRLLPFVGVFSAMLIFEIIAPKRSLSQSKTYRWSNNLSIFAINTLLLRLIFPAAAVGIAILAEAQGFGLFYLKLFHDWPAWLIISISILILDFAIWGQHLVFHKVPLLWRLHRMHHADLDIDVTTGLRFHPFEILLSILIKAAVIFLLGIPIVAVLIFEILLNATSMFNHSNIRLPESLDRWLRLILVTPDMHRVHHSWHVYETNSNYGFNLPWWDRLFKTYRAQPKEGHTGMTIGLHEFRETHDQRLDQLLLQPFAGSVRHKES